LTNLWTGLGTVMTVYLPLLCGYSNYKVSCSFCHFRLRPKWCRTAMSPSATWTFWQIQASQQKRVWIETALSMSIVRDAGWFFMATDLPRCWLHFFVRWVSGAITSSAFAVVEIYAFACWGAFTTLFLIFGGCPLASMRWWNTYLWGSTTSREAVLPQSCLNPASKYCPNHAPILPLYCLFSEGVSSGKKLCKFYRITVRQAPPHKNDNG
jgi:hypothetical protein